MGEGRAAPAFAPSLRTMLTCRTCRRDNPEGARFCNACAAPLGSRAPQITEERKVVSVLFADLVGFTSRAEPLDPEDVRALLGSYHQRVRAELERHGGVVEKFIGDAVVALFGAPVAHEDDPERAVRAALAIREAIAKQSDTDPAHRLRVRIGITTGEALVSLAAKPDLGEGMAAGDVVNTAARLQAAAPTGGILVDEATYRASQRVIEYRAAPPVEAKGKSRAIRVWEAVQARGRSGRSPHKAGRSPLVGRERELDVLRSAFMRSRQREPQMVTLVGVPGIGKSRLVFELFRRIRQDRDPASWREGPSLSYGEAVTFGALAQMVKAEAGIFETDRENQTAEKLRCRLSALVRDPAEAAWVEVHIRPLVGLETAALKEDRREEAFAAWRRFFEAAAEERPLVLVFEDLHWADDNLLDFVDHFVEWASGVPILVLCTARPELFARRAGWGGGKSNATTLSLSPLSVEETSKLVDALSEATVLPDELRSVLLERTGGNPLYAEEFVGIVLDSDPAGGEVALPDSVHGIIAARLDLLPAEEKALLQDAAVIGSVFWLGALTSVGGGEHWRLEERLHLLERREFVRRERRSSVVGETEYSFRHLLVRDVAYGQITRGARADKHRRAAAWIESLGRRDDHAEQVAHHYLQALQYARAAGQPTVQIADAARRALDEAGDRAAALNAFAAAADFYTSALDLAPEGDRERPQLLLRLGRAQFEANAPSEGILNEARDELLAAGDPASAADAEVMLGTLQWFRHGKRADASFARAVALVSDLPPSQAKAHVISAVARSYALAEDDRAIDLAREASAMAEQLGLDQLHAQALSTIGRTRFERGDPAGVADLKRSVEILAKLNSPGIMSAYSNLANALVDLGDLARAFDVQARRQRAAERFGNAGLLRTSQAERAEEDYWSGRWDEALERVEWFIAEADAGHAHGMEVLCRKIRALIRAARGETEAALGDVSRALDLVRHAYPGPIYPVYSACAVVLVLAGRHAQAGALADEVLSLWGRRTGDWVADLAVVLSTLGRGTEFLDAARDARTPTLWLDASSHFAAGAFERSAGMYAEIGSRPHEALARLRAVDGLLRQGCAAEADAQLERALAFYRSVGATRYMQGWQSWHISATS